MWKVTVTDDVGTEVYYFGSYKEVEAFEIALTYGSGYEDCSVEWEE